ncbi:MAG TPA: S8 family peptidase [Vicinamibacterales bacterium]|nr:S8 family peptidase [Vicinamibacterales bacterium]
MLVGLLVLAAPVSAKPESGKPRKGKQVRVERLDQELRSRSHRLVGTSKVIITVAPGHDDNAAKEVRKLGGRLGRKLALIDGLAAEVPNRVLRTLARRSDVISIHYDRPVAQHMNRAAVAVGARTVTQDWGYDGAGVGVAVIDSGITHYHDDLGYRGTSTKVRVVAGQRVTAFVDFVNDSLVAYDDNGHGTHVAGIIAGNGYDSYGARAGIAPAAHLVSLKVLDALGQGVISDVIAAFEWAVTNRVAHNIRVINLSVGARVSESYLTDPLTLAAKRATDAGIVVVTAAGNLGKKANGSVQYGSITAPGNAPWVLTVGASSTEGTAYRWDDVMASYSSRGPTAVDFEAKPDLVAPGTGIVSLSDPTSTFYSTKAAYLLSGTRNPGYKPYLSLSGTSMASPVVAGTVALMIQANPNLTPNLVKAILQYTAQKYRYDALTQGAGFLNAHGAVRLARYFARASVGDPYPSSWMWSKEIHWGNRRLTGGVLKPNGNAWALNIVWGTVDAAENIVWGTLCSDCENIVWGTIDGSENIVWGTLDGGENIVWGTTGGDENIVWGTACGGGDCENIVWGTAMDLENIVWGTFDASENIVWGTATDLENIVWGTGVEGEDVTWGSSGEDAALFDDPTADPITFDTIPLEELFPSSPPPVTSSSAAGSVEGGL